MIKLNKQFYLFLCIVGFLSFGLKGEQASGNTSDTYPPFEELFYEIGYTTVENALEDFNRHFNKELKLPTRVPPISFSHYFGRFNNLEGENNDTLEVIYVNEQSVEHHFKIDVRPIEHKISFEKMPSKDYKLKNGSQAKYSENLIRGFHLLIFETDLWQYVFSIDKNVSDEVTSDILVEIANSIDFN